MSYGLLNLNDHHIELFDGDQLSLTASAHVIFQSNSLITGTDAISQLRINPTLAYSKHWQQLDQVERKLPNKSFRHHADIAYYQLSHWFEGAAKIPLIVSTSFGYNAEQYALLAGLLQAHNQKPIGFCDSGLLYLCGHASLESNLKPLVYFFDLSLHNARLLALRQQQGQLIVTQQWNFPELGIIEGHNRWLKHIAQTCIRQTRYDPLHSAVSGQRLYAKIDTTLKHLSKGNAIQLDIDGKKVDLPYVDFLALNERLREKISALVGQAPLFFSENTQCYSGLLGTVVTSKQLQQGLAVQEDFFARQDDLKLHTSLPLINNSGEIKTLHAAHQRIPIAGNEVTHLLDRHTAIPLESSGYLYEASKKLQYRSSEAVDHGDVIARFQTSSLGLEIEPKANLLRLNDSTILAPTLLKLGDKLSTSNSDNQLICIGLASSSHGP